MTGATADSRRTTFTVFTPRRAAICTRYSPTPELAAFCSTHSPGCSSTNSLNNKLAVGGLTVIIASCSESVSFGSGMSLRATPTTCVAQVPLPTGSSTVWPMGGALTPGPWATTRPTPSLPPTAGSGGSMPYCPVSVSTSEGLIGAASTWISACPSARAGASNPTHSIDACGTGPRWVYWALCMARLS